jgi:excisionase family DNA binding protein
MLLRGHALTGAGFFRDSRIRVTRVSSGTAMTITDLATHPEPYVTVKELAEYWEVSRRVIYKQIKAGTLQSIRLGPRLVRIRTSVAQEFERQAGMQPENRRPSNERVRAHGSGRR